MCVELSRDAALDNKDFGNERTEAVSQLIDTSQILEPLKGNEPSTKAFMSVLNPDSSEKTN